MLKTYLSILLAKDLIILSTDERVAIEARRIIKERYNTEYTLDQIHGELIELYLDNYNSFITIYPEQFKMK